MNPRLPIALLVIFLVACNKDPDYPVSELISTAGPIDGVVANGVERRTLKVAIHDDPDAPFDVRDVHFSTTTGSWVSDQGVLSTGELVVTASADDTARAVWQVGRDTGVVVFTMWIGQQQFALQQTLRAHRAFPDTLLLGTSTLEYDTTNHSATLNVTLANDQGAHSLGLPITYRAWKNEGGAEVEVGNFVTTSYQLTNAGSAYSNVLDLATPDIEEGDTIRVRVACGSTTSRTLELFFTD